jgi:hypothetical protein
MFMDGENNDTKPVMKSDDIEKDSATVKTRAL